MLYRTIARYLILDMVLEGKKKKKAIIAAYKVHGLLLVLKRWLNDKREKTCSDTFSVRQI